MKTMAYNLLCLIVLSLPQYVHADFALKQTNQAFLESNHVKVLNGLAGKHKNSKSKSNTLAYSFFLITWKVTEVHGVWREPVPVIARNDIQNIEVLLQPYLVKSEQEAWSFAFMALYYKFFGTQEEIIRLPSYKTPNGKDYSYWYRKTSRNKLDNYTDQALVRDPKNPLALYLKSLRKLRAQNTRQAGYNEICSLLDSSNGMPWQFDMLGELNLAEYYGYKLSIDRKARIKEALSGMVKGSPADQQYSRWLK